MKIWLIQRSEPTPHDNGGEQRAMRTGLMAEILSNAGHDVLWWTSTFDHFRHSHRFKENTKLALSKNYKIQYMRGCGYKRNISLSRIADNILVAQQFRKLAAKEPVFPDIIVVSMPTVELACEAVKFGNRHGIPVVLDIRDLWPDVFIDLMPKVLSTFVRLISFFMKKRLRDACVHADGLIALTDDYLSWALKHAGRNRAACDKVFPMGYMPDNISNARLAQGSVFWRESGVTDIDNRILIVFIGTLGKTNDIKPIISAARLLESNKVPVQFIICGDGDQLPVLQRMAGPLSNVIFPGWVNSDQIRALLKIADIGICPYINSINYIKNIPNNPAEYLSVGLALAVSLGSGPLHESARCNEA